MFHLKKNQRMIPLREGGVEEEDSEGGSPKPIDKKALTVTPPSVSKSGRKVAATAGATGERKRKEIISKIEEKYNKAIGVSLLNFVPLDMICRDLETI